MENTLSFPTLSALIAHLKNISDVLGIFEYGGRSHEDMLLGGDYDLTLVTESSVSDNVNGIHFHVQGIPVDCMMVTLDELSTEKPAHSLLLAHMDARILHDPFGKLEHAQKNMQSCWKKTAPVTDSDINFYRFVLKHNIDKLEHRLTDDLVFSRYTIHLNSQFLLSIYEKLNELEPGHPRKVIAHMAEHEPTFYALYDELLAESELSRQYDLLSEAAERLMRHHGGLWKDEEVLFQLKPVGVNDRAEQKRLINTFLLP
ncbi:hypothetical protein CS022_20025 [Veronia nyctiphanis]|uniref:Nucleotidyltransferase n=1 Tax=Veronia nyctiphanis TaxID=1278244 RepID=A0A4V1LSH7_9GAMM|nr:hypothetical protein [Veronia nyctiphanis]RXJ71738.1 hypothetical protein CS022_20025 [Veronia nyctiphanis]